ncbi:C4-dicarboxylate ABC transporter [Psychrobacillus vulpis]|uniref:C4-dicarboxylate ABC transporter n=1 Tax=Psychrobacillus vulpis TaxID=2325572 RepID=A0A544TSG8_9BACI|nr:C4-dicarboxylate ABC transporter [Psychrobacillus vulpis]TQR20399.1 C4-dicarboxylate ABC transporter [Psychrobacillus vulpis]
MKASLGIWTGWLAIILAVVGFFYYPMYLGGAAVVLGLITLTSPQKLLAWSSIVLGAIAFFLPYLQ